MLSLTPTRKVVMILCMSVIALAAASVVTAVLDDDRIFPVAGKSSTCQETNPDNNTSVCLADSQFHDYHYQNLGPKMTTATNSTIGQSWNTISGWTWQYDPTPLYSGQGETDVIYRSSNFLPDGAFGWASCEDRADTNATRCDQSYVTYHGDFICQQGLCDGTSSDAAKLWSLACHESGHTLGLLHPDASNPVAPTNEADYRCMRSDAALTSAVVGSENVQAINSVNWGSWP